MRDHQSELAELGAKVLLISFSSAAKMQQWQRETGAPFPVVLDQHREAYKAYGLRRSYLHSWNARTIRTYVELHRAGRKWRGVQDDSAQLGGDFIIGGDGRVLFAHTSKDPVDRPDITELLSILRTST